MKILIADDDPQLVRALRITLSTQGYEVFAARDGNDALALAKRENPDLVLLDLGMPALDGLGVIAGLRSWSAVPIIVVSGRTGSADKIDALDAGADDYITKPFVMGELLARMRSMARRSAPTEQIVSFGSVKVNLATHTVTKGEALVHLTPTELKMIELLAANANSLVPRYRLLTEVWGEAAEPGSLRLYMSQLRKKLEDDPANPQYLMTEQGRGYRLMLQSARQ